MKVGSAFSLSLPLFSHPVFHIGFIKDSRKPPVTPLTEASQAVFCFYIIDDARDWLFRSGFKNLQT